MLKKVMTMSVKCKREARTFSNEKVMELRCYTEWSKSAKKQVSCINTYIWNVERWYWWTYL